MSSEIKPNVDGVYTVGDFNYGWFDVLKTRKEAIDGCSGTEFSLADVPNADCRTWLANHLKEGEKGWIYAWQGDTYDDGNVVLFADGQIDTVDSGDLKLPYFVQWRREE